MLAAERTRREEVALAASSLGQRVDNMMRLLLRGVPFEESRGAMSLLATLRDHGPCRVTELAQRERITQPSVTALVSRLERDGFVRRESDPVDGRVVLVSLTPAGRSLQQRVRRARAKLLRDRLEQLDPASLEILRQAIPILDEVFMAGPPATT